MRIISVFLSYVLISTFLNANTLASDSIIDSCANIQSDSSMYNYAINIGGKYFTSHGHVHCIVLFVEFPDDQYLPTHNFWPKGQAPRNLNTFYDTEENYPSGLYNISNYFYEMSKTNGLSNRLDLTGEGFYIILPHTRKWYADNSIKIDVINKDALMELDLMDNNLHRFDNWTFSNSQTNHIQNGDNQIDMVYILYRNVYRDSTEYKYQLIPQYDGYNWNAIAGLKYSGSLLLPNNQIYAKGADCASNSSGITYVKLPFSFDEVGSRYFILFPHELGHFLGLGH